MEREGEDDEEGSRFHSTTIESEASNPKKRKQMKPRSNVWDHFSKFTNENGDIRGKCKHCDKDYGADPKKNGTSGLSTHLRNCKVLNLEPNQTHISVQSSKDSASLGVWKYNGDLVKELYTKMIIVDELPFKFGDGQGFREFMAAAQPMFHIPSRWTVARGCFGMYVSRRDALKTVLHEPTQRVCLTTDTWTSNQKINYMCLTAHFIDKDWKIHKRILNFCPINSHKGEAIGLAIEKCLREWEISRVLSCTVDNASSNDVAMLKLKVKLSNWDTSILNCQNLHMRCVAHILNLIVQDGLKVYNESICKVRNAVRYVRNSVARLTRFKECVEFEKIDCTKSLLLDVPTRWNSTYNMLEVAEKYEEAFDRYDEQDPGYEDDLRLERDGIKVDGRPTISDWMVVRQFASFLKIFYDLTLKVSGTSYVTSNLFLHEIYSVWDILKSWSSDILSEKYDIGVKMLEKFNKYWGDPTKMNNLLFISVILDPRYKLHFVV